MDTLNFADNWFYFIIQILFLILCFFKVRRKGMSFIIAGIFVELLINITYKILPIESMTHEDTSELYNLLDNFRMGNWVVIYILSMIGITILYNSYSNKIQKSDISYTTKGSIGLYVSLLAVGIWLYIPAIHILFNKDTNHYLLSFILLIIGMLLLIAAQVYFLILLHRAWKFTINESKRLNLKPSIDSPGNAIGFLFIPFYNFYWAFLAYVKISQNLNAIAKAKGSSERLSFGLGLLIFVTCLICLFPNMNVMFLSAIISIFACTLFIYFTLDMCRKMQGLTDINKEIIT
jgi:hypothetical protein